MVISNSRGQLKVRQNVLSEISDVFIRRQFMSYLAQAAALGNGNRGHRVPGNQAARLRQRDYGTGNCFDTKLPDPGISLYPTCGCASPSHAVLVSHCTHTRS